MLILVASSQNPNFPVMFSANLHPHISGILQFLPRIEKICRIFWADSFHSFVNSPQVLGNWSVEKGVVLRVSVQIFGVEGDAIAASAMAAMGHFTMVDVGYDWHGNFGGILSGKLT